MSKKKGGKKGKGKGKGGDDELEKAKDEARMMTLQVEILQSKLVEQKEKADGAKGTEHEVKSKLFELEKVFREEEDSRYQIISNMTRQYKSLEQTLEGEKNELKKKVRELEEVISIKDAEILTLQKEKKEELDKKDEEIRDLRAKIQDMSSEFARMLRETLDKMQDRIEMAQWDNDHDPQIMKQLKEVGQ